MPLSKVSIGIKTFLRDEKLFRALDGISNTMPDAHVIVADDGRDSGVKEGYYASMASSGHTIIRLPFDSGFGAKSNAIANALARPYLLVGSDDFNFSTPDVRMGVERMLEVLETNRSIDIASGRVDEGPYEFFLVERQPGEWYERPIPWDSQLRSFVFCDLTKNYSLIRRSVFWHEGFVTNENGTGYEEYRTPMGWDDDVKIGGGEHAAFFIDAKRAGLNTAFVPGVQINAQPGRDSDEYRKFRWRALASERPCFKRRGIRRYVLANGVVDYEEKEGL